MFWIDKPLNALTPLQWEALCDRCGRCCLEKLTDRKTGKVFYTSVPCRLLDVHRGACRAYHDRTRVVADCQQLSPSNVSQCRWLPLTCAYRCLAEGRSLPEWHPLVTGDPASVRSAGMAVNSLPVGKPLPEATDLSAYIVDWGIWGRWRRRK